MSDTYNPNNTLAAITCHLDGARFAAAFKAVTATIGTDRNDLDTLNIMWISIWDTQGIELATFDGWRASSTYIAVSDNNARPDTPPDFTGTIRIGSHFKHLAQTAGGSSDSIVLIKPYDADQLSLPIDGAHIPPGIRVETHDTNGEVVITERGVGVSLSDRDWHAVISELGNVSVNRITADKSTWSALSKIADSIGPTRISFAEYQGNQFATVRPDLDVDLGFDYVGLVNMPTPEQAQQVADAVDLEALV